MEPLTALFIAVASLASGVVAGIFFAFSSFVMRALERLEPPEGVRAMQSINVTVICPSFLGVFMGTAVLSVAAIATAVMTWGRPDAPYLLGAGVSYLAGNILVTGLGNVPLNDALATRDADDPATGPVWEHYLSRWTGLNHVRTLTALLASALYLLALIRVVGG